MSTVEQYDIVIVGAGLVGASFAALLQQMPYSHLRVALIDGGSKPTVPDLAQEPPTFDPRVVALTHASRHLLAKIGAWQTIEQQRVCAYHDMSVWDHDGTANIHFSAKDIQQSELGHIAENSLVLSAVLNGIESQTSDSHRDDESVNVTLLRGIKVTGIQQNNHQVLLQCDDGKERIAQLLVAADGAQSPVRQLASMSTREWDYQHKAIVATVKTEQSHRLTAWQNFLPTGPLAFLPLAHPSHQYSSIVWSIENDKADEMMALDDEAFCQQLTVAFQQRLGRVEHVSRRFCFPLKQRHAKEYIQGNIVLIGDAAHTIHPLAGQGVNLGLLDAQALAEEIQRACERDLAINHSSVLRRYQRQRQAHNMEVMLLMEGLKRLFGSRHLLVRWLRNAGLKKVNQINPIKQWLIKQAIKHNG